MHTDEYEIAILREVAVCKRHMDSLQKIVAHMEKKYSLSSDNILTAPGDHRAVVGIADTQAWSEACTALQTWSSRKQEYEAIYRSFKI